MRLVLVRAYVLSTCSWMCVMMYRRGQNNVSPLGIQGQVPSETVGCVT